MWRNSVKKYFEMSYIWISTLFIAIIYLLLELFFFFTSIYRQSEMMKYCKYLLDKQEGREDLINVNISLGLQLQY